MLNEYRFQPEVVRKYIETVDKLRAANRIEDLFVSEAYIMKGLLGIK